MKLIYWLVVGVFGFLGPFGIAWGFLYAFLAALQHPHQLTATLIYAPICFLMCFGGGVALCIAGVRRRPWKE